MTFNIVNTDTLAKIHCKFVPEYLIYFNLKIDGTENKMQYLTIIQNLSQTLKQY